MQTTMALKTRLLLQACLTVALVLLLVGVGLYELGYFARQTDQGLGEIRQETEAMLAIENAHAHFKIQVQEWKNILIRGNDKEKFDRYLKQFDAEEKIVQQSLQKAADVLQALKLPGNEVEATRKAHAELGSKYRAALQSFDHADANAGKVIDQQVTGIDRECSKSMEKILGFIEGHFAQRMEAQIQSGQALYAASQQQLLAIAALGLGLIIILSLQNQETVEVNYLWFSGSLPLGAALLIAAVAGAAVVMIVGTVRLTQVRRNTRRVQKAADAHQAPAAKG